MFLLGRRKTKRLIQMCADIINAEEDKAFPSAEKIIIGVIIPGLKKADESQVPDNIREIEHKARTIIVNICFDQLSSGQYHLYRGQLNMMSEATNLLRLYNKSMKYAVEQGLIDEETRIDQMDYLNECISTVG